MRLPGFIVLLCLLVNCYAYAQCPPNLGFEKGTFEGWDRDSGTVSATGVINVIRTTRPSDRFTIISESNAGPDRYGHFSTLCPNGSKYSIRLGDDYPSNGAERVSYTYDVPAGTGTALKLNYALVLANPPNGHTDVQQPRFTLKLFNVTDNKAIPCPSFDFIARTGAGFVRSDLKPGSAPNVGDDVFYKDWSTVIINLEGYQGKKVRMEFTTSDCTVGDHLGYAYLDLDDVCGSAGAISGNIFCAGQQTVTLYAPGGYDAYTWYKGTGIAGAAVGSGQSLVINAPADQDEYTLAVGSVYGLCPDTLLVKLIRKPAPFVLEVSDKLYACAGSTVDLASAIKTPGLTYTYHRDSNALSYLPSAHAITQAGIYYIKGVSNPEGCMDIKPVEVIFLNAPTLTVSSPAPVRYPATVDISTTHDTFNGLTYTYYRDSNTSEQVGKEISVSDTYYIKAIAVSTGGISCAGTVKPVQITITPPPPYVISAPNTFTPNNDGINDEFTVSISGYITFNSLKIFNRYGKPVFTAKTPGQYWQGTLANKQLPAGTYYWLFEGIDSYYHIPARKGGWVTIIR